MTLTNTSHYATPIPPQLAEQSEGPRSPLLDHAARMGAIISITGMTLDDALTAGGLDFTVEELDVHSGADANGDTFAFDRHKALVRVDPDGSTSPLTIVRDTYQVVNYRDAFGFAQTLIDDFGANVVAVAGYGEPIGVAGYALLWMNRPLLINDTDPVDVYVALRNAHDGSSNVTAEVVPIHRATGAALMTDMGTHPQQWRFRHSGNVGAKFSDAVATVRMIDEWAVGFERVTTRLLGRRVTDAEFDQFTRKMLPTPRGASDRSARLWTERRRDLIRVFERSNAGGAFGANTAFAAYAAWTTYVDFHAPARGGDPQHRRNQRALTGVSAKDKARGWRVLVDLTTG